jgi:hypothetical protein
MWRVYSLRHWVVRCLYSKTQPHFGQVHSHSNLQCPVSCIWNLTVLHAWTCVSRQASKFLPFPAPSELWPPSLIDYLVVSPMCLLWNNESGLILSPCSLCVYSPSHLLKAGIIFMETGIYGIMVSEPSPTPYWVNLSHQYVPVYVSHSCC